MKKIVWTGLALIVVASTAALIWAQSTYPVLPRGVATDIKKADIEAVLQRMTASGTAVSDEALRTFNMADTHHVEIAILHYAPSKPDAKPATTAPEHDVLSELNYVIKGSATMVTGGTLENAKQQDPNSKGSKELFGPGWNGTFKDAVTRKINQGDLIVVPPHTPHNIYDVTSDLDLLVIRIDPAKVLNLK